MAQLSLRSRAGRIVGLARAETLAVVAGVTMIPFLHLSHRRGRGRFASRVEQHLAEQQRGRNGLGSMQDGPRGRLSRATRIGSAVAVGARLWGLDDRSCVARAHLTHSLLTRYRIPSEIRVGVAPDRTTAHAWVTVDGVPVDDSDGVTERYHQFDQPYRAWSEQ